MAKKTKSDAGNKLTRYDVHDWTPEFLANQTPMSLKEMRDFLALWLTPEDESLGIYGYGHDSVTAAMCPVFIGDAGVGKSIVVRRFAEANGLAFARMPMGESMEEDSMPVVKREYDKAGRHQYSFAPWMPMSRPDSPTGRGIMFADEIGTGAPGHQNLMATLLTDGYRNGYFGARVHPGWAWVAASNPMSSDYHLNWQLDRRLRDRLFPVFIQPTEEEVMYVMSSNNLLPTTLHGFLLLNQGHIGLISPRSWEQVGLLLKRHEAFRKMSREAMLNALKLKVPPATIDAFRKYLEIGDDPNEYPLTARDIVNADASKHETNIKRLRLWGENGRDALISVSAFDLRGWLADKDWKPTGNQLDRALEFVLHIPKKDLISELLESLADEHARAIVDTFQKNPTKERKELVKEIGVFRKAIGEAVDVDDNNKKGSKRRS